MIVHPVWIDAIHALKKFGHCHYLTWKVATSYLTRSWESHAEATQQVQKLFAPVATGPTLVLNLISYVPLILFLNWMAGFSAEYQCFIWMYSLLPTLVMGLCYYFYKFRRNMWQFNSSNVAEWLNNWAMAMAISMVSFTQLAIRHLLLLALESLLPKAWQGYVTFPMSSIESSVQNSILLLYALGLVLVMTCPVWCEGYRLVQELLERDFRLSKAEALVEIAYTTSQLAACLQLQTALAMIQVGFGFPFHFIHFAAVITEHIFFHRMVQFKFAWLHKLFHEVQPLHRLVHLEHHICKGTYPTTPAAGLWEGWLCGGTLFFCNTLACVPYLFFHAVSSGPNVVIHTMWPHKSCIQWHTLHHVANSDIYAANVPSENDKKFSRDVQKYKEKMKCSVFTRYSSASDVAGFAMSLIVGVIVHYICGIGLFHIWKECTFRFTG